MRLTREQMCDLAIMGAEINDYLLGDKHEVGYCIRNCIDSICEYADEVGVDNAIITMFSAIYEAKEKNLCQEEKEKQHLNQKNHRRR